MLFTLMHPAPASCAGQKASNWTVQTGMNGSRQRFVDVPLFQSMPDFYKWLFEEEEEEEEDRALKY